jgi:hypothetical protein
MASSSDDSIEALEAEEDAGPTRPKLFLPGLDTSTGSYRDGHSHSHGHHENSLHESFSHREGDHIHWAQEGASLTSLMPAPNVLLARLNPMNTKWLRHQPSLVTVAVFSLFAFLVGTVPATILLVLPVQPVSVPGDRSDGWSWVGEQWLYLLVWAPAEVCMSIPVLIALFRHRLELQREWLILLGSYFAAATANALIVGLGGVWFPFFPLAGLAGAGLVALAGTWFCAVDRVDRAQHFLKLFVLVVAAASILPWCLGYVVAFSFAADSSFQILLNFGMAFIIWSYKHALDVLVLWLTDLDTDSLGTVLSFWIQTVGDLFVVSMFASATRGTIAVQLTTMVLKSVAFYFLISSDMWWRLYSSAHDVAGRVRRRDKSPGRVEGNSNKPLRWRDRLSALSEDEFRHHMEHQWTQVRESYRLQCWGVGADIFLLPCRICSLRC